MILNGLTTCHPFLTFLDNFIKKTTQIGSLLKITMSRSAKFLTTTPRSTNYRKAAITAPMEFNEYLSTRLEWLHPFHSFPADSASSRRNYVK